MAQCCLRLALIGDQDDRRHDRAQDGGRVAALRLAVLVEHLAVVLELVHRAPPVRHIAVAGHVPEGPALAAATDQDGWAARLDGSREVQCLVDAVITALEAGTLLREHQLADVERLVEAGHPLPDGRELEVVADVLLLVPGRTQPKHRSSLGDGVQGRHRLGQEAGLR